MVVVWLSSGNLKIRLPIVPAEIPYNVGNGIQRSTLHTIGEVVMAGKKVLRSMTLASYFPARYDSNCQYRNIPDPLECVTALERWSESGAKVRVIIVGGSITFNRLMIIDKGDFTQGRVPGDAAFSLSLIEYVPVPVGW